MSDHQKPILYVEDEAIVAMVVMMALQDADFEIRHVFDGRSAVEALEQGADGYCAVVTDVRLPHLDGWQIARRARELQPEIPVVYVTGDSANEWSRNGVAGSIMIQKPFTNAKLVEAMVMLLAMDEQGYRLWGLPAATAVTFEDLSSRIHPADRDRVRAGFKSTRGLIGAYEIDFRILLGEHKLFGGGCRLEPSSSTLSFVENCVAALPLGGYVPRYASDEGRVCNQPANSLLAPLRDKVLC